MGPKSDPPKPNLPPPEPDDFVDFLQKANQVQTFDHNMLCDIADNGLQGKFKDKYDVWFTDRVIREVMEEEGDKDEDEDV